MSLNFVDKGLNVRIPNAYFMVKACTKEQDHGFIKRQSQYSTGMLLIHPLFSVVNGIPKDEFAIHSTTGHELKFGHGDH